MLTATQLKKFEKILKQKKQSVQQGIQNISKETLSQSQRDSTGELSGYTFHMADVASDNYERDFMLEMMSNEQQSIWEIDEALNRIKDKSYGYCEECNKKIGLKRLEAVPYARCCLTCQSNQESPKGFRKLDFRKRK